MSNLGQIEGDVIANLLPKYEAEGFDVYVHPSPSILPLFMKAYQPDVIALKKDRKIAIEIVGSTARSAQKVKSLQSLFADHDDWELRVFYASPLGSAQSLPIASQSEIATAVQEINSLISGGHHLPALVMAWATFEAISRALIPDKFERPQTPSRLVEVLGSEGYVTPDEADILRSAIPIRDAAVHGQLDLIAEPRLVEQFMSITTMLARMVAEKSIPTVR